MFKVSRIHEVETTDTDWQFNAKHKVSKPDVFRMTDENVVVASGEILPGQEMAVCEAADNCPVSAIEV